MNPILDHIVIDTRDRIAEGAARYEALGFQLTPMGRHSLGSANHLMIFGQDYVELLGTDIPGGALRPDIASYPVGLNGLVFKTTDADALSTALVARGIPALPASAFHRPVDLPDGTSGEARFKTVRLDRAAAFDGRIYWCEHLTPEHVWRAEWQAHPNGAQAVLGVLIAARDPERQAAMVRRMFGDAAVETGRDGRVRVPAGDAVIEVATRAEVAAELGDAAPDPAGRGDHMALVALRVRDLAATAALLQRRGVPAQLVRPGLLRVPATAAMNTAIDFVG